MERYVGRLLSTYLVCGFLGAGKTTYILERLKDGSARTAVLVNEFSALGIDGQIIRTRGGMEVVEMAGGCICCSQKEDLVKQVALIAREIRPDVLLIEPSGVAETSELLKALSDEALAETIRCEATITIVDGSTFLDYSGSDSFGTFFLDQVEHADLVLINKIDLMAPDELGAVEARIKEINSRAIVVRTDHCRYDSVAIRKGDKGPIGPHRHVPGFDSLSLELQKPVPDDALERFLSLVNEGVFGEVLRVKGFVRREDGTFVEVQVTPAQASVKPAQWQGRPGLVFVGLGLDRLSLERYFAPPAS